MTVFAAGRILVLSELIIMPKCLKIIGILFAADSTLQISMTRFGASWK